LRKNLFLIIKFFFIFLIFNTLLGSKICVNILRHFFSILLKLIFIFFKGVTWGADGTTLFVKGLPLSITGECTGIPIYCLFLAFAFTYPARPKNKMMKIGVGLLILVSLNLVRLITIVIAAHFGPLALDLTHDFLWPSTFFIFTLLSCVYYMRKISK
jgi:exosortase/archaeosortase family protein